MIRIFMVGFSKNKGGVERYISNLCGNLDLNKFEIIYDMPIMKIKEKEWKRPMNRHNYMKYHNFWVRFFKENQFDVLYYNTCDIVSLSLVRIAKRCGVPVRVIHSHSTSYQRKWGAFHRFTEKVNRKNVEKKANVLLACSEEAGRWMFCDKRFTVIKNGIELSDYKYNLQTRERLRQEYNLEERKLIGVVGRLCREKNPTYVIDIIKEMQNANVEVVFLGDGDLRQTLEEKVKQEELEKYIKFLGNRDNVNEWYSAFDCLLMPSLFEGLPFVLVEAQAAGLPCVVSDAVSKEADLTGLLEFVSLDDSKEMWCQKILEALEKPRKDTMAAIKNSGYCAEETAEFVSDLILKEYEKVCKR